MRSSDHLRPTDTRRPPGGHLRALPGPDRGRTRVHGSAWMAFLVAGLASVGSYFAVPTLVGKDAAYLVIGIAGLIAVGIGVRRYRPAHSSPWLLVLLANGGFVAGDAMWNYYEVVLHTDAPFPGWADVIYLAAYPLFAAGIALMLRFRSSGHDRPALLDTAMISTAAGMLGWVAFVAQWLDANRGPLVEEVTVLAYPAMSLLLAGATIRIMLDRGRKPAALVMFAVAMVLNLIGDTWYIVLQLSDSYATGHPTEAAWLASYVLCGAAALHPSMASISDPAPPVRPGLTRRRLAVLTAAACALPVLLTVQVIGGNPSVAVAVGATVMALLVMARMAGLMREVETKATELQTLDAMKDAFLVSLSHQIRTPLTSVLGFVHTLDDRHDRLTPEQRSDVLQRLSTNARKLKHELEQLLDLDRLRRGIVDPRRQPTDVVAVIRQVLLELEPSTHPVLVRGASVVAPVDRSHVERIVEALVVNALRYTDDGTPVWVSAERLNDRGVLVTVEDAGPGIPDHRKRSIFEAFNALTDDHAPTLGVGLSLVAQLAALHGGRAWVEDRPGGGACFRVFLSDGTEG